MIFPPVLNLSSEKLDRQGVFLLDNGLELFIWVGKAVHPELCNALFGKPSPDAVVNGKTILPMTEHPLNVRCRNLITKIRSDRLKMGTCYPHLYVVREDGDASLRMWFLSHLVEDRIENLNSYPQFLGILKETASKAA